MDGSGALLGLLILGSLLGCGGSTERPERPDATRPADVGSAADQAKVPPELQKPNLGRHFVVNDRVRGPELVLFHDPDAPQVVSLADPAAYQLRATSWSRSGRRLAVLLRASNAGIDPPNRLVLADAQNGFEPRSIELPEPTEVGYRLEWVGDKAVVAVTAWFLDENDFRGYGGRYLWIDADSGVVTQLSELPPLVAGDLTASSQRPSGVTLQPSPSGLLYVDRGCDLRYLEQPGSEQRVLNDCGARVVWSADSSFVMVTSASERAIYEPVHGQLLRAAAISDAIADRPRARFAWGPRAPRFVLHEGEQSLQISRLAYGDARGSLVTLTNLPQAEYAQMVSDDLLVAVDLGRDQYVLDVSTYDEAAPVELASLGLTDSLPSSLVATSDSSRLYYPQNPFEELRIANASVERETLLNEPRRIDLVSFRLLQSDDAGLLTMTEPESERDSLRFATTHQYLLDLRAERQVIPLGTFDMGRGVDARGVAVFQSAPQFGGIFYLSRSEHGHAVDWLGFDDISRKVRLVEFDSSRISIDFPDTLDPG
jgi:hypothetical protein